ncbi:MAG: c-type cytochrome biogenesis protein CcmI [Nitrospirota bacterium]|nr:c-type cytochrome biogenesis protein CcmI [Nitrospirota bacterium]
MTLFWLLSALMTIGAVLFVVVPLVRTPREEAKASMRELNLLIRRDQLKELEAEHAGGMMGDDQFTRARDELERSVLEESARPEEAPAPKAAAGAGVGPNPRVVAGVLSVAVVAIALGMYLKVGSVDALSPQAQMAAAPDDGHSITEEQLAGMVQSLADRLEANPDDPEGWGMLGRSYAVLQQFDKAAEAYARLRALVGDHPDVLSNYADALAMANGGNFTPESIALVERALEMDPGHNKSLWLLGTVYYERGEYSNALNLWSRLDSLIPAEAPEKPIIQANLAELRDIIRKEGGTVPEPEPAPAPAAGGIARITGTVTLDPALKDKVDPDAILFVFARAPQGPRMPLAIERFKATDLPVTFSLDETMSMMPQMSIASFPQVIIGARLSSSGQAMAASGDLQGFTGPVAVGSEGVSVVISEQVP